MGDRVGVLEAAQLLISPAGLNEFCPLLGYWYLIHLTDEARQRAGRTAVHENGHRVEEITDERRPGSGEIGQERWELLQPQFWHRTDLSDDGRQLRSPCPHGGQHFVNPV